MSAFPHARFLTSANEPRQFVPDTGAEVAFVGRSNSGKSSAINAITQRHSLARTSKTPGQTQLVNFFELEPGERLVDLPGYGFAQVPRPVQDHWRGLLEAYFSMRESLRGLFVVVDVRRGLTDQDERMVGYAAARGRAVHLLLTKADKVGRSERTKTLAAVRHAAAGRASAQLFSSADRTGVDEARRTLKRWLREAPSGDPGAAQ